MLPFPALYLLLLPWAHFIGTSYLQDPECLRKSENADREAQCLHQLCLQLGTAAESLPQGKGGEDYEICTVGQSRSPQGALEEPTRVNLSSYLRRVPLSPGDLFNPCCLLL